MLKSSFDFIFEEIKLFYLGLFSPLIEDEI